MKRWVFAFALMFSCFTLVSVPAGHAVPISYVFSGWANGSWGAGSFEESQFTIFLVGDTNGVYEYSGGVYLNSVSTGTITITPQVGDPLSGVVSQTTEVAAVPGESAAGWVSVSNETTFLALADASLAGYLLNTSLAPTNPKVPDAYALGVNTESGQVVFSNAWDVSFAAAAAPVPIPASMFLLSPALVGLAALRRRFRK